MCVYVGTLCRAALCVGGGAIAGQLRHAAELERAAASQAAAQVARQEVSRLKNVLSDYEDLRTVRQRIRQDPARSR